MWVSAPDHAEASGQDIATLRTLDIPPAAMDQALGAEIEAAARALGAPSRLD